MSVAGKLDVHAHYLPEPYRDLLEQVGHNRPDGMAQIPTWSPDAHLELMDRLGIATSLLSVSTPGVHVAEHVSAAEVAAQVNDIGRRTVVDHPGRFGLLASLPLPDVDAAIAEIRRCVDELHVDGFILLTNVAGTYSATRSGSPCSTSSTGTMPGCSSIRRHPSAGSTPRSDALDRCSSSSSTPPARW